MPPFLGTEGAHYQAEERSPFGNWIVFVVPIGAVMWAAMLWALLA